MCGLVAALCGCQSRAKREIYSKRLVSEVRVLEDQLYEADYHNRVLRDKLKRARIEASEVQVHAASPAKGKSDDARPPIQPSPDRRTDEAGPRSGGAESPSESTDDFNLDDLIPPSFDEGDPVDPKAFNELEDVGEEGALDDEGSKSSSEPSDAPPSFDPPALPGDASELPGKTSEPLQPAPGGPVPPSKDDTEIPPILPGEQIPPADATDGMEDVKPPGQILLPDSVNATDRIPDTLRIHQALSGGHRVEGRVEEMTIVVNVVNNLGKTINLNDFQVAAELSVVILDPKREPSEARIGRWNYDREQVKELVRSQPISGFHIPIDWQEFQPKGDEVIVHVRLRADEDEMRCEGMVRVEKQPAIAEWTPRGEALR
ncbi:MAG: hypothetical protein ACR2NZ_21220 [Rubripirellula sp.]